jgi:hypothetical protein
MEKASSAKTQAFQWEKVSGQILPKAKQFRQVYQSTISKPCLSPSKSRPKATLSDLVARYTINLIQKVNFGDYLSKEAIAIPAPTRYNT